MAEPFLTNLGVPPLEQGRPPTVEGFPSGLNGNNKAQWQQAVHEMVPSSDSFRDWGLTLRRYVELCEEFGVFPFQQVHQSHNDQIVEMLQEARRQFVYFANKNQFFSKIKIRSTHHKVTITDKGFNLVVYAKARIEDPTFLKWLEHLPLPFRFPFIRSDSNRHTKVISDTLSIFVENSTYDLPERWLVGYEISIPFYPDLPNNELPSRKEMERFVLDILWMPLIRSMRPKGLNHRLI